MKINEPELNNNRLIFTFSILLLIRTTSDEFGIIEQSLGQGSIFIS